MQMRSVSSLASEDKMALKAIKMPPVIASFRDPNRPRKTFITYRPANTPTTVWDL